MYGQHERGMSRDPMRFAVFHDHTTTEQEPKDESVPR